MKLLNIAGAVCALAVVGYALFQQSTSHTVAQYSSVAFTGPVHPTTAEVAAFTQARAKGQTLPSGWAITRFEGKVTATDTGIVMYGTNERAWTITVQDDSSDLATATFYVNGTAVYTATRANGGIIDRSGQALATLPALVPPAGQNWTGKVQWTGDNGTVRSAEMTGHQ
jgi:transposase InsO family protein